MSDQISQRELRNDSGRIMRALDRGESFVVTRNGQPVAELSPLRRGRFVRSETVVSAFHGAPPVDYQQLRSDLDRLASQDAAPRA